MHALQLIPTYIYIRKLKSPFGLLELKSENYDYAGDTYSLCSAQT
jgi:hypothetical protein